MTDQLEELLRACTVRVTGGPAPGAGFFVAPGKIMTCMHVIGKSDTLMMHWHRDDQATLEVAVSRRVAELEDRGRPIPNLAWDYPDIAVIEVDGLPDHPCVGIDTNWPWDGDSFRIFGYPKEGGRVQLTPAVLTYRGTHGTAPRAYLDLGSDTIKPGMSGAALLNLRTRAVCGIVVASKNPTRQDGGLAVPMFAIEADLREVLAANRAFHLQDRCWEAATISSRDFGSSRNRDAPGVAGGGRLMRVVARWAVAIAVSVGAFAVSWWVCQALVRLDEGATLGVAGAVLAVVLAVAGWWAAQERRGGEDSGSPRGNRG